MDLLTLAVWIIALPTVIGIVSWVLILLFTLIYGVVNAIVEAYANYK